MESAIDISLPQFLPVLQRWYPRDLVGVPPHISLIFPWRVPPLSESDLDQLAQALNGTAAFDLVFREWAHFPNAIYLRPEPVELVLGLIQQLTAAFPDTPPYGGAFADVVPHMTVGRVTGPAEAQEMELQLQEQLAPHLPLSAHVDRIAVHEQAPNGMWSTRREIRLLD